MSQQSNTENVLSLLNVMPHCDDRDMVQTIARTALALGRGGEPAGCRHEIEWEGHPVVLQEIKPSGIILSVKDGLGQPVLMCVFNQNARTDAAGNTANLFDLKVYRTQVANRLHAEMRESATAIEARLPRNPACG